MFDYGATADTAKRLIANFGMAMTHIRIDQGDPVPGAGYPNAVQTRTAFVGVRTSLKAAEVQAGLYAAAEMVVLMAGDAVPDVIVADKLEFQGQLWDVTAVVDVKPAEITVLRKIGVTLSSQKPKTQTEA